MNKGKITARVEPDELNDIKKRLSKIDQNRQHGKRNQNGWTCARHCEPTDK